jgi:hypothetical protein
MRHGNVEELRKAASYYPLNYTFRSAAALKLGNAVLESLIEPAEAVNKLDGALKIDNAPDLLMLAIIINLKLDDVIKAQMYYDRFKLVAKHSYFLDFMKAQHK